MATEQLLASDFTTYRKERSRIAPGGNFTVEEFA